MYPGIGVLHLVKLKLVSGNTQNPFILSKYGRYILEIILVQSDSHTHLDPLNVQGSGQKAIAKTNPIPGPHRKDVD